MSEIPGDLKFLKSHEWARVEGNGRVTVGISDHAQGLLGDLVYVELPNVGDRVEAGNAAAVVESVKAASDVYSPVTGTVVEVNADAGRQAGDDQRGRLRRRLDLRGGDRGTRPAERPAGARRLRRTAGGRGSLSPFPPASRIPLPAALCGRFAFRSSRLPGAELPPPRADRYSRAIGERSSELFSAPLRNRKREFFCAGRNRNRAIAMLGARASPVVFEVAATTFGGRKSLRKSAHLDFCEAPTSGSPQCRKRFRLFLSRRRIDAQERRGSPARIRRHESDVAKKPH